MPRARFTFVGNTIVPADGGAVALLRCASSSDEDERGMPWAYFPTPGTPKAIGVSRTDRDTPSIDWRALLHLDVSQKGITSHADAVVLLVVAGALARDAHERAVDPREQPLRVADLAERGWATTVPAAGQKVRSWIKPAAGLPPFASCRAEAKGKGLLMWFEDVDIRFDPPLARDLLPLDRAFVWLRRQAAWSLECLGKLKFTLPLDLATSTRAAVIRDGIDSAVTDAALDFYRNRCVVTGMPFSAEAPTWLALDGNTQHRCKFF